MDLDQIEELIRRYLAAGVAVVVILVGPVTGSDAGPGAATAPPGAVDRVDGEVDVRDGTPGADGDAAATAEPDPGEGPGDDPGPDAAPDDEAAGGTAGGEDAAGDEGARENGTGEEAVGEDAVGGDAVGGDAVGEDAVGEDPAHDGPAGDDPPGDDGDAAGDEPAGGGSTDADAPAGDGSGGPDPDRADPVGGGAGDPGAAGRPDDPGGAVDAGPAPSPPDGPVTEEAVTAAERFGWGRPEQVEEFRTADLAGWDVYRGPGHQGRGERSPDALAVDDGVLTISGDARGTTGGLCWRGGQRYGRWEARVRAPEADPAFHALLLLWPDADDYPTGGQVALLEVTDPERDSAEFYLHHGEDADLVRSTVRVDATRWRTWAVEWTPDGITGYVDGAEWFSSTDPATLPPGPMHLCAQLDFVPDGDGEVRPSRMDLDWVRQYAPAAR